MGRVAGAVVLALVDPIVRPRALVPIPLMLFVVPPLLGGVAALLGLTAAAGPTVRFLPLVPVPHGHLWLLPRRLWLDVRRRVIVPAPGRSTATVGPAPRLRTVRPRPASPGVTTGSTKESNSKHWGPNSNTVL